MELYISTPVFGFVAEMPALSKDLFFFFPQETRSENAKQGHTRKHQPGSEGGRRKRKPGPPVKIGGSVGNIRQGRGTPKIGF